MTLLAASDDVAAMILVIGVALVALAAMLARRSFDRALDRALDEPPSGPEPSVTR